MTFRIGKLPYAVLIDKEGIVRGHGLTNNREHLESLFEAMKAGVSSIQEYQLRRQANQNPTEVQYYEPS
jgi:methylamine dehydrogenase accessory protein MauD